MDTSGPLGRAVIVIISAIAELERNLIVGRVKAGVRRARLEERRIGRPALEVGREELIRDRERGLSLSQLAKQYQIGDSTVRKLLRQTKATPPKGSSKRLPQLAENKELPSAA